MTDSPRQLLITRKQLCHVLGICRSRLFAGLRNGNILPPIEIDGVQRWRYDEVRDWVDAGLIHCESWRWRPSTPIKLDDLIRLRTSEVLRLGEELRQLEIRRNAGDTVTHISKDHT